jgi:hypothetical protein
MTTVLQTLLEAGLILSLHAINLKMEVACFSETSVSTHETTRCNNGQDYDVKSQPPKQVGITARF